MNAPDYPFSNDRVVFSDAVAFIATVVYPKEKPARARKLVRDRLYRYRGDRRIPGGQVISAVVFFRSVLKYFSDWHQLLRVQNLPGVEGSFDQAGVNEKAVAGDTVTALVIPGDIERARSLIQALQKDNLRLTKRIQYLEILVKELEPFRAKDLAKKAKISNKAKAKRRHRD